MSTNRSAGPSVPTQKTPRPTTTRKKDRSTNLCTFTFADGRQCRTPRCSGHLHLCWFHAQKEAESLAAQQVGQDISRFLPTKLLTACDLGAAMSRLFCAVAQGQIKPKSLPRSPISPRPCSNPSPSQSTNILTPSTPIFGVTPSVSRSALKILRTVRTLLPPRLKPARSPPPRPRHLPLSRLHHRRPNLPPQPAPSPHTPLPPTITEFFQQVKAGRNTSLSEIPTPSGSEIPTLSEPGRRDRLFGLFLIFRFLFLRLCPGPKPPLPNPRLHRPRHRPRLAIRNLPPRRPRRSPPHLSHSSQPTTRSTTLCLRQRRQLHRLCHPASEPPPTGTS